MSIEARAVVARRDRSLRLPVMRVVGGTARGFPLRAVAGGSVRPTSDRVREAVFDILGSLGAVEGADVLDLFAGTGALGIEALSRGARRATFVERDPAALTAIRENLRSTGFVSRARVVRAEVLGWLGGRPRPDGTGSPDLALCDPPYGFASWQAVMGPLRARLAVLEAPGPVGSAPGWDVLKTRQYGGTVVTLMKRLPLVLEGGRE